MQALSFEKESFISTEPFKGLFTQGMVCHETYKDENNKWLSPDEVLQKMAKIILKLRTKKNFSWSINQCQNQRKIPLIRKKLWISMALTLLDFYII